MNINAGRNSAVDVIVQSIMNKEENGKKKRPSFSTIFDKLNSKKIDSKKPLNNLLTQEQMFRYYINDTEPLLKVSNDSFLQNLDLFGGSDIKAQYDMVEGQISLGVDNRGKKTIPEGFNDPEIMPKKIKNEIEPKINEGQLDPELLEEEEDEEEKEDEEIKEDEEAGVDINRQFKLLDGTPFKLFDFPAYEAGNNFLRIEPKRDEFEDALERKDFLQIYGEQPKLEDLLQASGNYLSQIQPNQFDPFLNIPTKKQQIEPKEEEEAGMDIVSDVLGNENENTEIEDFIKLEPEQPKGQLRKFDEEWINFKKRVNDARDKGSTKKYRANIEKWLNE